LLDVILSSYALISKSILITLTALVGTCHDCSASNTSTWVYVVFRSAHCIEELPYLNYPGRDPAVQGVRIWYYRNYDA